MNPLWVAIIARILQRKRPCPRCGKRQNIPVQKGQTPVHCTYCGATIPKPK